MGSPHELHWFPSLVPLNNKGRWSTTHPGCIPFVLGHTLYFFFIKAIVEKKGEQWAMKAFIQISVSGLIFGMKTPGGVTAERELYRGQEDSSAASCSWCGGRCCGVGVAVLAFSFVPLTTPPPSTSSRPWLQGKKKQGTFKPAFAFMTYLIMHKRPWVYGGSKHLAE